MSTGLTCPLTLAASLVAGFVEAADPVSGAWEKTLQQAAMVNDGMERFRHSPVTQDR